jgi:hypothetical protein
MEGVRSLRFACSLDVTLLAPDEGGVRRIEVTCPEEPWPLAPGARLTHRGVTSVRVACEALTVDVTIHPSTACELWRLPIETVTRSERGFEAVHQGTSLVFVWDATVEPERPLEVPLVVTP